MISTRSDQNIITHLEQNVQEEQNKNLNPIDCNVKYFIARAVSVQVRNIGLRFLAWSQSPTMRVQKCQKIKIDKKASYDVLIRTGRYYLT